MTIKEQISALHKQLAEWQHLLGKARSANKRGIRFAHVCRIQAELEGLAHR
jgi:hypothetical protein